MTPQFMARKLGLFFVPMKNALSPFARPPRARVHLNLDKTVKEQATKNARLRYGKGCSLSKLVNALLARENELKGGLVHAKIRVR